jgi:hypothetical protein
MLIACVTGHHVVNFSVSNSLILAIKMRPHFPCSQHALLRASLQEESRHQWKTKTALLVTMYAQQLQAQSVRAR